MKESFLDKMNRATKVKVKMDHSSQVVQAPKSAIRQARDLALRLVCFEENCTIKDIEKNPHKYDHLLESAFRGSLLGYAESVIPAKNPGRHRAEAAISASNLNDEDGFWRTHFGGDFEKRRNRKLVFKSAVMKISDVYIEGIMKIPIQSMDASKVATKLEKKDIGMNRSKRMIGEEVQQVIRNQFVQLLTVTTVLSLLEKFFEISRQATDKYIDKKLQGKSSEDLSAVDEKDENISRMLFVKELQAKLKTQLANINLENILK